MNCAAVQLCEEMASAFDDEISQRNMLRRVLEPLSLGLKYEYPINPTPPLEIHSACVGLYISNTKRPIVLGEIKNDFESGDPYMQVSRSSAIEPIFLTISFQRWQTRRIFGISDANILCILHGVPRSCMSSNKDAFWLGRNFGTAYESNSCHNSIGNKDVSAI